MNNQLELVRSQYNLGQQTQCQSNYGLQQAQNSQCGISSQSYYYPYYPYQGTQISHIYYSQSITQNDFAVRKVDGGWIITKDGKEHVITEAKEILKFLKDQ